MGWEERRRPKKMGRDKWKVKGMGRGYGKNGTRGMRKGEMGRVRECRRGGERMKEGMRRWEEARRDGKEEGRAR